MSAINDPADSGVPAEPRSPLQTDPAKWSEVQKALEMALKASLNEVLEGAASDIQTYVDKSARLMVYAIANNRPDLIKELQAQNKVLLEINRIRVVNNGWKVVDSVTGALVQLTLKLLTAAVIH